MIVCIVVACWNASLALLLQLQLTDSLCLNTSTTCHTTTGGKGGYTSSLVADGTTFKATYVFDNNAASIAAAQIVFETQVLRALSWVGTDPAGNRLGITISEKGEAGGPGFGG
jgi:hypothetical protein